LQVILTTLLKVYVRGGLFEKSRDLLVELDTLGFAKDEVNEAQTDIFMSDQSRIFYLLCFWMEIETEEIMSTNWVQVQYFLESTAILLFFLSFFYAPVAHYM